MNFIILAELLMVTIDLVKNIIKESKMSKSFEIWISCFDNLRSHNTKLRHLIKLGLEYTLTIYIIIYKVFSIFMIITFMQINRINYKISSNQRMGFTNLGRCINLKITICILSDGSNWLLWSSSFGLTYL